MTTQQTRKLVQLEQRVENLEENVEGVEPPKSREMQKIEELEDKINKLVKASLGGATGNVEVSEEMQDSPGHEVVDIVREEKLLDPEELDAETENTEVDVDPEVNHDLFPVDHDNSSIKEKKEALVNALKHLEEPSKISDIVNEAYNQDNITHTDSAYTGAYQILREKAEEVEETNTGSGTPNLYKIKQQPEQDVSEQEEDTFTEEDKLKMIKEDLDSLQKKVLNNLSETLERPATEIAKTSEELDAEAIRNSYTKLKGEDLIETTLGSGAKLTDKGAKVTEVETPEKLEFTEEDIIDADKYDTDERMQKIIQELEESYKPLSTKELTKRVYRLPEDKMDTRNNKHYSRVQPAINKLQDENLIQVSRKRRGKGRGTYWELTPEAMEKTETTVSEEFSYEQAKNNANVSDSDMTIVETVFDTLINEEEIEEINYFDFEERYAGNTTPIRMFQKLFSNPELLEGVRRQVCPEKDFHWTKTDSGEFDAGEKNWMLKVSDK